MKELVMNMRASGKILDRDLPIGIQKYRNLENKKEIIANLMLNIF